ncbi:RES family NAD+ phosphorylase [Aliiroseovarius sediminis]|uniref:RES family NAD+ phosphorylase n=1 Tax=Aliiroseovarius sediminis TaxID=2925839 RepID=UPI001F57E1A4|nr:RES family NAD+ phosphorylase [Aliiroseovarius sediminis]MCI2393743.1 RES family NAD+ phosphorylase [Aliiroseovarius sediminis]
MLPHIWTPDALRSEHRAIDCAAWRLVEAQHVVATLGLVDTLDEQALLEDILEDTKPPMPDDCRGLDYLLYTPFRYRPYPHGSRFRRAGWTPGVWYGAEHPETAVAEMVFYRFLFYAESPATVFPDAPADYTAFSVDVETERGLDLTTGRLAGSSADWMQLIDYAACQTLADTARETGVELIRFTSVRDSDARANLAVLTCSAFKDRAPQQRQSWHIRISANGAQAVRDHPRLGLEFGRDAFADDPRLGGMIWDR